MANPLQIVVDGVIYQYQSTGGISRLFSEILPRICSLDEAVQMTLFTTGPLNQGLPEHQRIRRRRIPDLAPYLRPAALWGRMENEIKQAWQGLWIGKGKGKIWHSTYFTHPQRWDGLQVVTVADMIYERFPDLFNGRESDQFRALRKRCVMAADAVLCISEATRRDVQDLYQMSGDRIHVVHLACSDFFGPLTGEDLPHGRDARSPFFLYVGSRTHYKNFDGLINAYGRWKERGKVRLLVVGPPWTLQERQRLTELGIADQVDLVMDVHDEALCGLYNRAVAFIYPSLYEGFGIPLLEAMACGCPVIASRIATTVEVAGGCPIYFKVDQADSLIEAFNTALTEGRHSFRVQAGFEHVKHFSWDKTARETLSIYRSLS